MASLTAGEHARMYALAGVMRAGASRANYTSPLAYVAIAGVQYAAARAVDGEQVDNDTLAIQETAGDTPNTATFQVRGFQPTDGQDVVITLGSKNNLDRLFAGTILTNRHGSVGTPANGRDAVTVIDYTWQLTRDTISQRWQSTSGTVIARDIIAHANRGFTSLLVEEGLPVLDEFTVTNKTHAAALSALCDRMGATWKSTYHHDVQLGLTANVHQTDPTTVTEASAALTELTDLTVTRDLGQVITRQPVEGGGSNALTAVPPGETILPVASPDWYNPLGGTVVSGPQRLVYTGVQLGGAGSLIGPGVAPSVKPAVALALGGSLTFGDHQWAYSWVTAAGKTLPAPLSVVLTARSYTPPTPAASVVSTGPEFSVVSVSLTIGASYAYKTAWTDASGTAISALSPASAAVVAVARPNDPTKTSPIHVAFDSGVPGSDPLIRQLLIYRSENGGAFLQAGALNTGTGNEFVDHGGGTGAAFPGSAAQTVATASLTGVALGPTGTTAREIYQTAAGGSQLKLQQTIANNTATTATASAADGSLGANAPVTDTSGLTTAVGQVNAGSTALLTASAAPFSPTGGWAIGPHDLIRYTGITGNTLTGIPASGPGAILSTLKYGDHLDAAPALTGIPASGAGAILYAIKQGDPVNLRVVIDDLAAQAVIAARMGGTDDGIIEGDVIQDGRISETEARARGAATLALRSALDVAITGTSHDLNLHAGRTLSVNLPAPHPYDTVGAFKVQSVDISQFTPARWPTRTLHAASRRFTLEALLREARGAAGGS